MALYEITLDCRISNKDYKKGDVVSDSEVIYFPSVMKPIEAEAPKKAEAPKVEEKEEVVEEKAEAPKIFKKQSKKK